MASTPDTPISSLKPYTTQHPDDLLVIVDVHDTSMAPSGTDDRVTVAQLFGSPANGDLVGWVNGVPAPITLGTDLALSGTPATTLGVAPALTSAVTALQTGQGGMFWSVAVTSDRDAIPLAVRVEGMQCFTQDTQLYWSLLPPPWTGTGTDWMETLPLVVEHNGTAVATSGTLNFIDGTGITLTVANNTTSDRIDITLETTVTGILKGNGTAIAAAVAGTDYVVPSGSITGTAANVTGIVAIANGGTDLATVPTDGQLLIGNGTGYTLAAITPGTGISVTNGAGAITVGIVTPIPVSELSADSITITAGAGLTGGGTVALGASTSLALAVPVSVADGGTGQTTAAAAFDGLSPITTLGDLIYGSAASTASRLAGNTSATKQYLVQTGTGTASAAPAWAAIAAGDVPVFLPSGTTHAPGAVPDPGATAGITRFLREDANWINPAPVVQVFTTSGTWTKPAAKAIHLVELLSAGNGGSGGSVGALTAGLNGGDGGAGGLYSRAFFPDADLPASVAVTVGAGGAGGAGAPSTGGTGSTGSLGSVSSFGTYLTTTAPNSAIQPGNSIASPTGNGQVSSSGGLGNTGQGQAGLAGGLSGSGGGAGSGITTAGATNFGSGGGAPVGGSVPNQGFNGGAYSTTGNAGNGGPGLAAGTNLAIGGGGGGGGGSSSAGTGGNGGAGGASGGGGGGGGCAGTGYAAGAGGAGANGIVVVTSW